MVVVGGGRWWRSEVEVTQDILKHNVGQSGGDPGWGLQLLPQHGSLSGETASVE